MTDVEYLAFITSKVPDDCHVAVIGGLIAFMVWAMGWSLEPWNPRELA